MKIQKIAKILGGQDGAIFGTELFRFDTRGNGAVYDISNLKFEGVEQLQPLARFRLDRADELVPHSNAVCFGSEFYEEGDEYPLLYTNIYNNYSGAKNEMIGVCLVYRIERKANEFKSTLVQRIEIGFAEDAKLWKTSTDCHGVRPYGNFLVDTESGSYWAFVMRNEALGTRYFRFDLPPVREGDVDPLLHIKRVVLKEEDIREFFDCQYHRYIQGAALHKGKIYSTEGFSEDEVNRPAIRVIDLAAHTEEYFDITKLGFLDEPELISFYGDTCLYSDVDGNAFLVEF